MESVDAGQLVESAPKTGPFPAPSDPILETNNPTEPTRGEQKLTSVRPEIRQEDQELFNKTKARIEKTPDELRVKIEKLRETNARIVVDYRNRKGMDMDEKTINQLNSGIRSAENGIRIAEDKLRFLRPRDKTDIEYRLKVQNELASLILDNTPNGLPLRFHGTSIYNAEHIIKDGELSSSVDRLDIETSYDLSGQISVTKPDTVRTTLSYADSITENYQLPAGCIFVMLPKSAEDAQRGDSMLMSNVSFKENPQKLFAVLASPEMLSKVKEWMTQSGLDAHKVFDHFAFIDQLKQVKQNINSGLIKLEDVAGYKV